MTDYTYDLPSYSLNTMTEIMDIHRREMNSKHEQINNLRQQLSMTQSDHSDIDFKNQMLEDEIGALRAELKTAQAERKLGDAQKDAKIKKLQSVIESLKLDLANERKAHTEAREAHADE